MADSTIGKAFVQIVPSADGITEQMNAVLGAPSREAGEKAGAEMSGSMAGALGSGLLSAVSGIASEIAGAMKAAISEVSSFVADSVSVGMDFDSQMSQIAATMGLTTEAIKNNEAVLDAYGKETGQKAGDTFDMLRDKAKEMGAATNFSAAQAAEGLNILAMSGYDAEHSVGMIEDVLHLAAAGGMDMATSAKDISGAMKGFADASKDSAYYADLMAKGATLANTNVTQLGEALSGAAAQGGAYKQSAEGMTLALLRLAEQGETGANASTMLGAAMKNLYTPTDQAAAMKELGVSAYEQDGSFKDINEVVNTLNKSLSKYSDEQQAAYINTIFGIQGQEAYNKMVVTSVEKQNEWAAALKNSSGEAAKQYTTMTDNLAGDIDIWNSALEGFKIEIADGVMPTVREFVQFGSEGLSRLTAAFKEGGISGMVSEFSKLLEELTAKVVDVLPQVTGVFTKLFIALAGNLADILPTFVGAIKSAVPEIISALFSIGATLTYCIPDVIDMIAAVISEALKMIPGYLPDIAEMIKNIIPDLINDVTGMLPLLLDTIIGIINTLSELIPDVLPPVFEAIVNAIPLLAQTIADNLPVVIQTLTDLVSTIAELIPDILPVLMPALTDGITALIEGVAAAMEELPELISAVIDIAMAMVDAILDNLPLFMDCAVQIMQAMGKAVYDHFPEIMDALGKLFVKLVDVIEGWFPKMWSAVGDLWVKIIDGIEDNWDDFVHEVYEWGDSVLEAFGDIWDDITEFWGGLWDKMVDIGGDLIGGIVEGLKKGWEDLKANVTEFGDTVVETFCDIFDIGSPSKVMEDEVGKFLAQGIGEGFEDEMDGVIKGMSKSVGGIIDELTDTEMNADFSKNVTYTPVTDTRTAADYTATAPAAASTTTFIVALDSRELARATFADINEFIGQTVTLQAMGAAT
jgi:TP901 family phage tail tape measure protein